MTWVAPVGLWAASDRIAATWTGLRVLLESHGRQRGCRFAPLISAWQAAHAGSVLTPFPLCAAQREARGAKSM